MRAFLASALLASVSHARRVQVPFDQQAASSSEKYSERDSVKVLEMLALAANPNRHRLPTLARSARTVMGGWGGAKNEHGHTRELNLDIPGEIADGAFLMDDDDMYGEESYEEHKPYTGAHPSEQKTASSGSSGGYELEDFGSSGGSSGGYELEDFGSSGSGGAGDFGGAKNEHGHTRVINLDIPGEIADGAFLMDDDDLYGEESYEEHKPYTGAHPSEQKTASSGSSGGYELEDFYG